MKSMVDAGFTKKARADYQYARFLKNWNVIFDKRNSSISSDIGSFIYSSYRVNRAPFFNEKIRRILVEKFGEEIIKKGGLSVYTTVDGYKQDIALKALKSGVLRQRKYLKKRYRNKKKFLEKPIWNFSYNSLKEIE